MSRAACCRPSVHFAACVPKAIPKQVPVPRMGFMKPTFRAHLGKLVFSPINTYIIYTNKK